MLSEHVPDDEHAPLLAEFLSAAELRLSQFIGFARTLETKINLIQHRLVELHRQDLLLHSRNIARQFEKTPWHCTTTAEALRQVDLHSTARLELRLLPGIVDREHISTLKHLLAMDSEREFMVVYDLKSSRPDSDNSSFLFVMSGTEPLHPPSYPWHPNSPVQPYGNLQFDLTSFAQEALDRAPKIICSQCNTVNDTHSKLQKCSLCKYSRYCSAQCQKASWSLKHKEMCPLLKQLKN